jgi:hypothetical protein
VCWMTVWKTYVSNTVIQFDSSSRLLPMNMFGSLQPKALQAAKTLSDGSLYRSHQALYLLLPCLLPHLLL